ncbi:MAG: hypothetical protein U1E10_01900, partial [Bdellovibrionales bacterium]|nr:hypothetical protein [Bdellovibrionales bacterium]
LASGRKMASAGISQVSPCIACECHRLKAEDKRQGETRKTNDARTKAIQAASLRGTADSLRSTCWCFILRH